MKSSVTILYQNSSEKKPLSLLISKSTGENLPLLEFPGLDDIEIKDNVDLGELKKDEVLLVSILDHPSSNFVVSTNDIFASTPDKTHTFNIATSHIAVSLSFASTASALTLDAKFEKAVKFLEDFTIPWYLRSSQLYSTTKNSISKIQVPVDDETQKFIDQFSNFLQTSTELLRKVGVPILSQDEVKILIPQIDELLNKYFLAFDETVDQSKVKLVLLLREFKKAILYHSEKFLEVAQNKYIQVKETSEKVLDTMNTSLDSVTKQYPEVKEKVTQTLESAQLAIKHTVDPSIAYVTSKVNNAHIYVSDQYPVVKATAEQSLTFLTTFKAELLSKTIEYIELTKKWIIYTTQLAEHHALLSVKQVKDSVQYTLENTVDHVKTHLDHQLTLSLHKTQDLLITAQPYVHQAVKITQPYITQLLQYYESTPYGSYLNPYVNHVLTWKDSLEKNPTTGPYIDLVLKNGVKAYENVKTYCIEDIHTVDQTSAAVVTLTH